MIEITRSALLTEIALLKDKEISRVLTQLCFVIDKLMNDVNMLKAEIEKMGDKK